MGLQDNEVNANVHPNSRAARGDAIDAERRARDEAAAADAAEQADTTTDAETQIADLTVKLEDAEVERDAAQEEVTELTNKLAKAEETAAAAKKTATEATERADKAEARVKELEAAARAKKADDKPATAS